jgi:predicted permease
MGQHPQNNQPGERDQKLQSNNPTGTYAVGRQRTARSRSQLVTDDWTFEAGVTLPQAEAMMTTIDARLQDGSKVPQGVSKVTLSSVTAIHPALYEAIPIGVAIVAVAGLILLICCVNVASLMLARAIVRRKEFAIRMALGGSRERIVRQLLTEALLLSIGGGALGLLFAYWTMRGVIRLLPPDVGFSSRIAIDWRVLLFSFVASLLTALVFGLLPALNTFRLDPVRSLAGDAMSPGGRRRINLRRVLVVIQIVASLVLLISTGLCLRSFQQGEAVTKNFKTDRMLLLNLNPTQYGYSIKYNKAFYRELLSRVVATPGVEAATLTNVLPLTMDRSMTFVRAEGRESMRVQQAVVADGYFKALDIPVLQGRPFEATDDDTTRQVVIVNEALARTLWPGQNALGKTLRTGPDVSEVVGVVRSTAYNGFGKEAEPYLYVPLYQDLDNTVSLIVRTSGEPRAMMSVVQREIKALGGNLPIFDFKTLEDVLNGQLLPSESRRSTARFVEFDWTRRGVDWNLRSYVLLIQSANKRDWRSHGAGSGSQRDLKTDNERGN